MVEELTGSGVGGELIAGAVQLERSDCAPYQTGPWSFFHTNQQVRSAAWAAIVMVPPPMAVVATLTVEEPADGPVTKWIDGLAWIRSVLVTIA
jgi:hypothetical protein